ncbi:hypothetical protein OOT55_13565 [Marinimicrobium sp. C6131]|uniref:hypothetical protein n=1 Tax=Marinimicrobium sp. C6131 TaxID=3022676 RepID=UPI00223D9261|nr:hypothetical protein [Marinimicrobium sp. C6131]UZJ43678.1 hypothetical protein OOT55_13565 [Marinimicrobium sp. C6131]
MIRGLPLIISVWLLLAAGCATVEQDDYALYHHDVNASSGLQGPVSVRFVNPLGIEFRGVSSSDDSVGSANVLYSGAAGAGGVAAQIAAHAVMVQDAQDRKLENERERANRALEPVSEEVEALQSLDPGALTMPGHFIVQSELKESDPLELYLETHPIFFVTENLENLSLKNVVVLRQPGRATEQPVYQNVVEIVSDAPITDYTEAHPGETGLEDAVKTLYQKSVLLALDDIRGQLQTNSRQPETFRHQVNGVLRLERGVTVQESCSDLVLRNLRGWIISLPQTEKPDSCVESFAQEVGSRGDR